MRVAPGFSPSSVSLVQKEGTQPKGDALVSYAVVSKANALHLLSLWDTDAVVQRCSLLGPAKLQVLLIIQPRHPPCCVLSMCAALLAVAVPHPFCLWCRGWDTALGNCTEHTEWAIFPWRKEKHVEILESWWGWRQQKLTRVARGGYKGAGSTQTLLSPPQLPQNRGALCPVAQLLLERWWPGALAPSPSGPDSTPTSVPFTGAQSSFPVRELPMEQSWGWCSASLALCKALPPLSPWPHSPSPWCYSLVPPRLPNACPLNNLSAG